MSISRIIAAVALFAAAACSPKPPATPQESAALDAQARATLAEMRARQPAIDSILQSAAGYAVFPDVGKAGALIAGGAHGKGILFEGGQPVGYVTLSQGSLGPQIGAQSFAELLILQTPYDVAQLKAGKFDMGAGANAVVLNAGAAVQGTIDPGTRVFVKPKGGMMAGLDVSGQQINFTPAAG